MFVRIKKSGDRQRVQIVKSVRNGDRVQQKVVRHVGTASSEAQLEQLRSLGRLIIEEMRGAESQQASLFSPIQHVRLIEQSRSDRRRPVPERVRLASCREQSRLVMGIRECMGEMYRLLGFPNLLGARKASANRIIQELVVARIAQPLSKRATVEALERYGDLSLNLDQVYKSMDHLDDGVIERIRAQSRAMAEKVYTEPIQVVFYDTTTLYFESERADGLRAKGYSKDGKHHRVQVVFALLSTEDGLPVGYELFPGDIFEGHTLIESLRQLRRRFTNARFTVVADAAMISRENQSRLREEGIRYILGARLKSQSKAIKRQILSREDFQSWGDGDQESPHPVTGYRELRSDGCRLIVTHSSKRARKDARLRAEGIARLRRRLSKSKSAKSLTTRGYGRFLDFPQGGVAVNEDKIAQAARWDGLSGIVAWGLDDTEARELVSQYRRLWQIEACFRTNKHDLKIRPIFHWAERRIKAHIAICYMAFCTLQHVRYRLRVRGVAMSADHIRKELHGLQWSILLEQGTRQKYAMPSRANSDARRIYRSVGLSWNEAPFAVDIDRRKKKPVP